MKVIHIVKGKADPNTMNGVNRIVHGLANEQFRSGRDVEVWGLTSSPDVVRHTHDYPLRLFRTFGLRLAVPALLRGALRVLPRGDTIVQFHSVFVLEFYAVTRELERLGIPWVHTPHGGFDRRSWRKNWLLKQIYFAIFERRVLRGSVAAHATGRSEVDDIARLALRLPIVLIQNGLEPLDAAPSPQTPTPHRPRFGYCGRLVTAHKGLDLLLHGFAQYVRSGGTGELWLIGGGKDRKMLEGLARDLGIAERVTFTGPRFGDDKQTTLGELDVFTHTSRWEGFPMMLLEASMLGLPVIASKGTNFDGYVEAFKAGLVLDQNEPAAIAASMHRAAALHATGELKRMGDRGREMMLRDFSWGAVADRLDRKLYCVPDTAKPPGTPEVVLERLFAALEADGLAYVVVGDSRSLPAEVSSDVDLVFSQSEIDHATRVIRTFARRNGLAVAQVLHHEHSAHYVCLTWQLDNRVRMLKVDYCGDYMRHGRLLLSSEDLLAGRVQRVFDPVRGRSFRVPETGVSFLYYLIKRIDKVNVEERTTIFLSELWGQDEERCRAAFLTTWSVADLPDLAVVMSRAECPVEHSVQRLRAGLHGRRPVRIADGLLEAMRKIRRLAQPTGLFVAVIGPDGAGKTAVIEGVIGQVGELYRRVRRGHLRPNFLPRRSLNSEPVTDPHGQPPYGWPGSVFKLSYMATDYLAGFWFDLRIALARSTLVIFDRYYHDLVADPRRWRYGGPPDLPRMLARLLPMPNLVIVLDAPAETILRRKREVGADECQRQIEAYRAIAKGDERVHLVDAAQALERVTIEASGLIVDEMVRRVRLRNE